MVGGPIRTLGGVEVVYPAPGLLIATPVTTQPLIVAIAVALVLPTPMLTSGVVEYPTPPVERTIEDIVPAADTTAVAAADTVTVG